MWVQEQTAKNRNRSSNAALELEDILAEERKQRLKRIHEQQATEETEKKAKIRNKEKLIDDLMFGEEDADTILEQHREQVLLEKKTVVTFSTGLNVDFKKEFKNTRERSFVIFCTVVEFGMMCSRSGS
jgi:hypothetical protein